MSWNVQVGLRRSPVLAWLGVLAIALHVLLPAFHALPLAPAATAGQIDHGHHTRHAEHHGHHHDNKAPADRPKHRHGVGHDCALCQLLKHAGGLPPPTVPAFALDSSETAHGFSVALSSAPVSAPYSRARPRAPPLPS